MKYMGSKLALLDNGLSTVLLRTIRTGDRFVDLFCGTGRVAWHVAESVSVPVLAVDLQQYSAVLAGAIVGRTHTIDPNHVIRMWLRPTMRTLTREEPYIAALSHDVDLDAQGVIRARHLCANVAGGPVWRSYGGHYFSPRQAATFDHLISRVPGSDEPLSTLCRAALVLAASRCAAAPGHTAQPFQPTRNALPYIRSSWDIDPIRLTESVLTSIAQRHARLPGQALVADANSVACNLRENDVVFVDPPYSNVHYSRFYHVLETVARGSCGVVSGVGRYPPSAERPKSRFSIKTQARGAMLELLKLLASNGCRVVLTFPQGDASNGLNGEELLHLARQWFRVDATLVASRFSTLGGNGGNRSSRRRSGELVMTMMPL